MGIVVVGSVALDTLETPKGKHERILGGSASHFSVAASNFTDVKIVGVIGNDFPEQYLEMFKHHKINIDGIEKQEGKTFFWSGRYGPDFGDPESLVTELGVFANFNPKIPDTYKNEKYLFVANIAPKLQIEVIDKMKSSKFIGADTMNFWINSAKDDLLDMIKRVDLLIINELEVKMLSGIDNVQKGAKDILNYGPKILVVKRGVYGSMMFSKDDYFVLPAFPVDNVTDTTGAGDSFAGGMMGYLAANDKVDAQNLRNAMVYGTMCSSFGVQDFSTLGLETITKAKLDARINLFKNMTLYNL